MLSSSLTVTELLAIAGIVLGAGGFALSLLKHGLETRSQREARYRFFREYVNDIGAYDGVARTPPLQVALGYYALGGRPGCAADEVRHVIDLSQHQMQILRVHRQCLSSHIAFDRLARRFEWRRWCSRWWVRSAVEVAGWCVYTIGIVVTCLAFAAVLSSSARPPPVELTLFAVLLLCYGTLPCVAFLVYAMRLDRAATLRQWSHGQPPTTWRTHPLLRVVRVQLARMRRL
jgi:hypothetical protein